MGYLRKVKSLVGGSQYGVHPYRCLECGTEFKAAVENPNYTACPDCGSDSVITAP